MTCNHEIIIDNFKTKEAVHYSIILIKGRIKNDSESVCQNETICIEINNKHVSTCKLFNFEFKILVELDNGENCLNFNICSAVEKIVIMYVPRKTQLSLLPLYIICDQHNGCFQAPPDEVNGVESAIKRITLGTKLLQCVIAEKLYESGMGRKTFRLEDDCRVFHSKLHYIDARKMNQSELWNAIAKEIVDSELDHERIKFLGFLSCTRYDGEKFRDNFSHLDVVNITEAYVALGGGGLALFGTACLFTWPEELSQVIDKFNDATSIDRNFFMDDSCYRGTIGYCFSTTLGSVLHELCHIFDLGHTKEGIMARDFDDIYKFFISWKETNKLTDKKKEKSSFSKDDLYFSKGCLMLLRFHKWFNDYKGSVGKITFDTSSKIVYSTAGLRIIQVRKEENGMVLEEWTFDNRILRYSFQLRGDLDENVEKCIIVVEDNLGNILKHALN